MAKSDKSTDPLAHTDALRDDAAVSAALGCVGAPQGQRWEEDEDQDDGTLLELFSLIAEVGVVDEDVTDDTPVSVVGGKRVLSTPDSTSDSPASTPQAMTRKLKKRRYQEVIRMRQTAAELERQLGALKCRQDKADRLLQRCEGEDAGVLRWQRQATKEIQATARARLANTKLKKNVEAQTEFLNSLQEALAKRQCSIEELQQIAVPCHRNDFAVARRPRSAKESEIYGLLIKNIYARAYELDEVFRINVLAGIQQSQPDVMMDASTMNVLLHDDEALNIDLIDGYVIPFDFQAGARVLWTHVLSKQLEVTDTNVQTEVIVTTDDVLLTKQTASSNFLIQDHELTTEYSISKRVCDTNCVNFLWESITESQGSLAASPQGTPAIQVVQKGFVKVKPLTTANGSSAASLQAYVRLSPSTIRADSGEADAGEEGEDQRQRPNRQQFDVKVLTAHMVSSYRLHAESIRRFLENALIDEMLTVVKPAQQC